MRRRRRGQVALRVGVADAYRLRAVLEPLAHAPTPAWLRRIVDRLLDQLWRQLRGPRTEPRYKA
jgi:hypothetical protein